MDHAVQGLEGFVRRLALEGGVGGGAEGGEDVFVLALEVLLGHFEVLAEEFLGQSEEGLVLRTRGQNVVSYVWEIRGGAYEE